MTNGSSILSQLAAKQGAGRPFLFFVAHWGLYQVESEGNQQMPDQSKDVPKRKLRVKNEAGFQQRIWKLWLVIFAAGLAAAFTTSMVQAATRLI